VFFTFLPFIQLNPTQDHDTVINVRDTCCRWNRKVFRSRGNEERERDGVEVTLGGKAF